MSTLSPAVLPADHGVETLARFVAAYPQLFVLTGAGVSTDSGIPDYRDRDGSWKRKQPIQFHDFVHDEAVRRRYWARALVGWRWFATAQPNGTHHALAELQATGRIGQLVTQNVDRLHQRAGARRVIDLHGRLDRVQCLGCGHRLRRAAFQDELSARNPAFAALTASGAPDGDADLDGLDFGAFKVPSCPRCGGILKPTVVFFGEGVPHYRVQRALRALERADAMLVVGSSLMVFSGYRFCRAAAATGKPIAAVTLGRTRADDLLALKIDARCAGVLPPLLQALSR